MKKLIKRWLGITELEMSVKTLTNEFIERKMTEVIKELSDKSTHQKPPC